MTQPPAKDLATDALARIVPMLCEDALFAITADPTDPNGALDGVAKRRVDVYGAAMQGTPVPRMLDNFDAWIVQLARAMAPVAPPAWLPMMEVVREKVSLEIGARGLRSLFSSKPSDKDVLRVKRFGALATRLLRAVFVADGALDREEQVALASLVTSYGLPENDANALYQEAPIAAEQIDTGPDMEPAVARALVRGAWLGAAWDMIDPREEQVVRVVAHKLGVPPEDVEVARSEAQAKVDARRAMGMAAVDCVRYVLSDRSPGVGVKLPALVGALTVPRRYRDEALAQIGHGAPVTLARRYVSLPSDHRVAVLAMAWAAALLEDPTVARRALLRARWERLAEDMGEDSTRARAMVDDWVSEVLSPIAKGMK